MKISEVNVQNIIDYLRISEPTQSDTDFISAIIVSAKNYISQYTGYTIAELDNYEDVTIALYVLCQDMYDTRSLYVQNNNANRVVESILNLHSINLLPQRGLDD